MFTKKCHKCGSTQHLVKHCDKPNRRSRAQKLRNAKRMSKFLLSKMAAAMAKTDLEQSNCDLKVEIPTHNGIDLEIKKEAGASCDESQVIAPTVETSPVESTAKKIIEACRQNAFNLMDAVNVGTIQYKVPCSNEGFGIKSLEVETSPVESTAKKIIEACRQNTINLMDVVNAGTIQYKLPVSGESFGVKSLKTETSPVKSTFNEISEVFRQDTSNLMTIFNPEPTQYKVPVSSESFEIKPMKVETSPVKSTMKEITEVCQHDTMAVGNAETSTKSETEEDCIIPEVAIEQFVRTVIANCSLAITTKGDIKRQFKEQFRRRTLSSYEKQTINRTVHQVLNGL